MVDVVLLSDRFHKNVDWILLEKGISETHGTPGRDEKDKGFSYRLPIAETTALKCLRPVPIGLSLGNASYSPVWHLW